MVLSCSLLTIATVKNSKIKNSKKRKNNNSIGFRVTPGQKFIITQRTSVRFCTVMWIYNVVYASLPFYGIAEWRGEGKLTTVFPLISWLDRCEIVTTMVYKREASVLRS